VNALAYTVGHDVVFAEGQYSPSTNDGRHLLAHELAHVIQQEGDQRRDHLQRQEAFENVPAEIPAEALTEEPDEDEDVEDGDTDVPGLDQTPDFFELEPHGPEPLATPESSVAESPEPEGGGLPLGRMPTGKIKHIDVDQASQRMVMTFIDGQSSSRVVSTGRGECGTAGDPCKTQKEHHCTPNGTFTIVSRGNANTKNSKGDAMAWFVGMNVPGRQGIGIHNSQIADGSPRSHGCVRVGKGTEAEKFAKMVNEHVIVGKTDVTISGKAKTKAYPCPKKKTKKP
jgi:lipoprotein-anchoring transpeptidase ErfK/SrfK